jgi:hypothetical protein
METINKREAWNKGKLVDQKPPLKLKDIWAAKLKTYDRYLALLCTRTLGHHLPLAVTFGFFTLSGSKRPLYGDEVGT